MDYEEELAEEKSFKMGGVDEEDDELFGDDDSFDPNLDEGLSFDKEDDLEEKETEESY